MIDAFTHGKLSREQENMEDLLTSSVFGLLKHAPVSLQRFLMRARTVEGNAPLVFLENSSLERLEFWRWLTGDGCNPCEPDVLIQVSVRESPRVLLIEAKFRSGKSSFALGNASEVLLEQHSACDQLAREWQNLAVLDPSGWVIYLTADFAIPRADIHEAQQDLPAPGGRICWLSWRDLFFVEPGPREESLVRDLRALLTRLDLRPFLGIDVPAESSAAWRFRPRRWIRTLLADSAPPAWRFARRPPAPWFTPAGHSSPPTWRFLR